VIHVPKWRCRCGRYFRQRVPAERWVQHIYSLRVGHQIKRIAPKVLGIDDSINAA